MRAPSTLKQFVQCGLGWAQASPQNGRYALIPAGWEESPNDEHLPMSTAEQTIEQAAETGEQTAETIEQSDWTNDQAVGEPGSGPAVTLELGLGEAQALHTWLLTSAKDGVTALDEPLVNRSLTALGNAVQSVQATVNVRHELEQAGLAVDHLSDEQVRELGRRVTHAVLPGVGS
jgi:hypothetical protein